MDLEFEGTKQEFAKALVLEIKDKADQVDDRWYVDAQRVAVFASACSFVYELCDKSYGDLLEIDDDPGEECSVSAHFDALDIQDDLFGWFKELLLQIDRLEFLPNHEEETIIIKMTVYGVWRDVNE